MPVPSAEELQKSLAGKLDFKGLRSLVEDHPRLKRRIVVCLEKRPRRTEDGIEILPVNSFLEELKAKEIIH